MSFVDDLLAQLTLDEKISLLAGADSWHTTPIPRLGIPKLKVSDGPNGVRGAFGSMGSASVATPVGIALGASWNPELVEKIGRVIADELNVKGASILLGPTVNIHRTPIAGRNFECYSEDPYLSGMIAAAFIKGIQSRGLGACIKHFVANDQEYERTSISSEVDERTLREIYLEPFRLAIRAAKPWAVMSSYNRINGVFACENDHTLIDILKGEWGFEGIVLSDWGGTYDEQVPAGGLDLEMPGPAHWMAGEFVRQALDSGRLTQDGLDDKVRRLLGILDKAGLFENHSQHTEKCEDKPEHRLIMREAARESIVILKNNELLPFKTVKSVAVIGPYARQAQILGGGSSGVTPHYAVSAFDGIRDLTGGSVVVDYAPGCFIHKRIPPPGSDTLSTPDGKRGLHLSLFSGAGYAGAPLHEETTTCVQHDWYYQPLPNVPPDDFSMRMEGLFTPRESGLHTLALTVVGRARLYLDGKLLLDCSDTHGAVETITIELDLSGSRPYPLKVEYSWQGSSRTRSLALGHLPPHPADLITEAVELARRSDRVVLVVGLSNEWESEGFDRANMKLPGQQDELVHRVAAANPNTCVVLNSGSPLEMPWVDEVSAIVQLWYNGQEQGNALAEILFGKANPSGKLPITFPVRLQDNPAYINYPGENGRIRYGEGIFVGYRYYDTKELAPLFPFGHGLSYTHFSYSNLKLSSETIREGDTLTVTLEVTNSGTVGGGEVVQLYVHDFESKVARPEKELKAFQKIFLASAETKSVAFVIDREAFWYFDSSKNNWEVEPGDFEILVGASSRDIRLRARISLSPGIASEVSRNG